MMNSVTGLGANDVAWGKVLLSQLQEFATNGTLPWAPFRKPGGGQFFVYNSTLSSPGVVANWKNSKCRFWFSNSFYNNQWQN